MQRYVKLYNNVLDPVICKEMIDLFEANPQQHEKYVTSIMDFKQINLIVHDETWKKYNEILKFLFTAGVKKYKEECKIESGIQWPTTYAFEQFRMKRYEPNEGRFDLHTDVNDMASSKRFLAFFLYLNGGEDGETDFPYLNVTVPRIEGGLLMFPPLWTYPHAGNMPKKAPKYIVGSYLHYVEDAEPIMETQ